MSVVPVVPVRHIVLDIEGTLCPVAFVHDVLFPYAAAHLRAWLAAHAADAEVAAVPAAVGAASLDAAAGVLCDWIAQDRKEPLLKALQGRIWADGYADGSLQAALFDDVAAALVRWRAAGVTLWTYSSGSLAAQELLLAHTTDGELWSCFAGGFDLTTAGPKQAAASYVAIAAAIGAADAPGSITFVSDVCAELDAAAAAGWRCVQSVRAVDATVACGRFPAVAAFVPDTAGADVIAGVPASA